VRARLWPLALPAVIAVAAANFLWQLGSSSYFVDEVQSVDVATRPLGGVLHATATLEVSPPAYFYFEHEWLGHLGSLSEWAARLPSAICGILLAGPVWWLATLVSDRRAVDRGGGSGGPQPVRARVCAARAAVRVRDVGGDGGVRGRARGGPGVGAA